MHPLCAAPDRRPAGFHATAAGRGFVYAASSPGAVGGEDDAEVPSPDVVVQVDLMTSAVTQLSTAGLAGAHIQDLVYVDL